MKTHHPSPSNINCPTLDMLMKDLSHDTNIIESKSEYEIIEDLQRGAIVGLMLFSNAEWFSSQNRSLMNNRWAYGPFCYHIKDVHRLKVPMEARGQLGSWIVQQSMHARIMDENPEANQKIQEWRETYASKYDLYLYFHTKISYVCM